MTTRRDASAVPLQGGYVAKQCPVRAQNDALRPTEPLPPSPVLERRFLDGREFETELVAELMALHPEAFLATGDDEVALEAATVDAMARGEPLILGGRLPADPVGRRVGKPDVLVVAGDGYRPVDIKHHMSLEVAEPDSPGLPALCCTLDRLALEDGEIDEAFRARKRKADLMQLAHYQRLLEAAGLAPADGRFGGIIGVERRLVWYDLDAAIWRTGSSSGRQKARTTMETYDFEFAFRLDIIAAARQHLLDPSEKLLVVPVRIGECAQCPWWDYCRPQLEEGAGDVSLLPKVGWREWKIHRDHGVHDRAALADLDLATARAVAAKLDVPALMELVKDLAPDTPVAAVADLSTRPAQLERLAFAGIATVGDVLALKAGTASYSDAPMASLPAQIDAARAALGPDPVYRRRGFPAVTVPRADVEVDVDMENVEEGVYLWGTLLTDRADDAAGGYLAFVTWEPLDDDVETENFLGFWTWMMGIRADCLAAGRTFRAYCYSGAENGFLRKLGLRADVLEDIEAFIASADWVDMLQVFDRQLTTGGGVSLKMVAPLAGFTWPVDDPGGEASMIYHAAAVGAPSERERDDARAWLFAYNRGDVEATLALREWMDRESESIKPIECLDPESPQRT